MVYRGRMSEDEGIDYEALRMRFPWVGLVDEDWGDVATRYRRDHVGRPHRPANGRSDRSRSPYFMNRLLCDSGPLIATFNKNVPHGAAAEIRFLDAILDERGDFDIVDPVPEDRRRAVELANRLVAAPVGYVDAMVIAIAERLRVPISPRSTTRWSA
jgi:hypothetical protein